MSKLDSKANMNKVAKATKLAHKPWSGMVNLR